MDQLNVPRSNVLAAMDNFDSGLSDCLCAARELLPCLESRVARFALAMVVQSIHDAQGYFQRARYIVEHGDHGAGAVVDVAPSAFQEKEKC